MKTYRTQEQFQEIVDSCTNGNWTQAANECIEYGFYAQDLINAQEACDFGGFEDLTDIATLIEMATEIRCK